MNKIKYSIFALVDITILVLTGYGLARAGVLSPPQRVALAPDPGSHTVPITSSVSITYDQDMDPATVTRKPLSCIPGRPAG